jgi:hypothetical protein
MRRRLQYAYLQDDFKVNRPADAQPGRAVRIRHAVHRSAKSSVELRSGDQNYHCKPNGSLYDRSLVDPDYNNFAPRSGLCVQLAGQNRRARWLRHRLRRTSTVLAAPICWPPTFRRSPAPTSRKTPRWRFALAILFAEGCFRPTQAGYPTNLPNNVVLFTFRAKFARLTFKTGNCQCSANCRAICCWTWPTSATTR